MLCCGCLPACLCRRVTAPHRGVPVCDLAPLHSCLAVPLSKGLEESVLDDTMHFPQEMLQINICAVGALSPPPRRLRSGPCAACAHQRARSGTRVAAASVGWFATLTGCLSTPCSWCHRGATIGPLRVTNSLYQACLLLKGSTAIIISSQVRCLPPRHTHTPTHSQHE